MALTKRASPSSPSTNPATAAAHEEIGAIIHIGAAVESMILASLALDILNLSETGLITLPTVRQLK